MSRNDKKQLDRKHKSTDLDKDLKRIEQEADRYFSSEVPSDNSVRDKESRLSPEEFEKLSEDEKMKIRAKMPLPVKIIDGVQDMIVKTGESIQQIQEEMHENYLKRKARLRSQKKIRQQRRLERIERREARVDARYQEKKQRIEKQNEEINKNLLEMKKALYEKKAENRDKFHKNLTETQDRMERVSAKRQRNIERVFKGINKWAWRQQLKIILIIIPLLIVFVIVFLLLRQFLVI